jgi:hypothetical protein
MEKVKKKCPRGAEKGRNEINHPALEKEKKPRAWRQSGEWDPSRLKEGWDFWI